MESDHYLNRGESKEPAGIGSSKQALNPANVISSPVRLSRRGQNLMSGSVPNMEVISSHSPRAFPSLCEQMGEVALA